MRSSPWIAWRRYVAGSRPGIAAGAASVEGQHIAHFLRPGVQVEPVLLEQGEGDALQAETHAGAVRDRAVCGLDVERHAEMVEVVVARADRRRLLRGADRDHELEL